MALRWVSDTIELTVENGQTASNVIGRERFGDARGFCIQAPATLPETCTLEVSLDGEAFATLQMHGEDVTIGAGKAVVVDFQGWEAMRISAGASAGADRTFLMKVVRGG